MDTYVKFIDKNSVEVAPKNKRNSLNYNENIPLMKKDGYLPLVNENNVDPNKKYNVYYEKTKTEIRAIYEEIKPTENEVIIEQIIAKKAELSETDWYVIRAYDTDEPVPEDIHSLRTNLRAEINELEEKLS